MKLAQGTKDSDKDDSKKTARLATILIVSLLFITILIGFKGYSNLSSALDDRKLISEGSEDIGIVKSMEFTGNREDSKANLTVEFIVNDKLYTTASTRAYTELTEKDESGIVEDTVGHEIKVYYDSSDPDHNVVEGNEDLTYASIIALVLVAIFSIALLRLLFRIMRTKKHNIK